jgi:predicted dithiol-disulfide oxidoreductase (DUF899 family)
MASAEISALESKIFELTCQLNTLRRAEPGIEVKNYNFATQAGDTSLLELFGERKTLLVIHNMGQGCRYCTLWADGLNGFLPHLESVISVVLVSKDPPELQREFANSRGWRFRLASHGGGEYIEEQSVQTGVANMPGAVIYTREGNTVRRKNAVIFGPGDMYCPAWNLLAMAGLGEDNWTPQFSYWRRPVQMDDGGANLPE